MVIFTRTEQLKNCEAPESIALQIDYLLDHLCTCSKNSFDTEK